MYRSCLHQPRDTPLHRELRSNPSFISPVHRTLPLQRPMIQMVQCPKRLTLLSSILSFSLWQWKVQQSSCFVQDFPFTAVQGGTVLAWHGSSMRGKGGTVENERPYFYSFSRTLCPPSLFGGYRDWNALQKPRLEPEMLLFQRPRDLKNQLRHDPPCILYRVLFYP